MRKNRLIWIPRVITLVYALFLVLFSFDVFEGDSSMIKKLLGFLVHNLPTIALILIIILTWKRPMIAGLLYLVAGLIFTIFFKTWEQGIQVFGLISLPLFIVGAMYLVFYFMDQKTGKKIGIPKKQ